MDHSRFSFSEEVISRTYQTLEDSNVAYDVNGHHIRLANALENPIILNVTDGVVHLPSQYWQTDGAPVVAVHPGETISLGEGFDTQSPLERAESMKIVTGWGLEATEAECLVDELSTDFSKIIQLGALSFGAYNQASTVSLALAFNLPRLKERYGLPQARSAKLGRIAGRNLIVIQMQPQTLEHPEVFSHEVAHLVERTNNPIKTMSSQRVSDMRQLREELKAYQVGARVYMHQHGIVRISDDAEQVTRNSQLRVEFVRGYANQRDTDPYRTTPQLVELLGKAGMDIEDLLHGRPDIERMLTEVA